MEKLFPTLFDLIMQPIEKLKFHTIRRNLLSQTKGRVLKIGSGTGANFPYYQAGVTVDAIEPNAFMIKKSEEKKRAALVPITTHEADAESLPFEDNTFESVIATLVFCTIQHPLRALSEIKRVAKPGAPILFFEHVRMENPLFGLIQDILTPAWKKVADGCHLNRDTQHLIKQSGFHMCPAETFYKGLFLVIKCHNPF